MAGTSLHLSRPSALVTLRLELLHHSWPDLLALDYLTFSFAVFADRDMVGVISSTSSAMWTYDLSVILEIKIGT